MTYRFLGATLLNLCIFLLTASAGLCIENTVTKIAAVVNGEMVTLHDLRLLTLAEMRKQNISEKDPRAPAVMQQVLDLRINDILLRQEATRFKLSISDREIEGEMQRIMKSSQMSNADFEKSIKKQGMTRDMLKERIRDNMLRQRMISVMIARKVVVTREEVEAYYSSNKDDLNADRSVDFSVLIFNQKAKPESVLQRIKKGELSFESAAKQYSLDATASKGGRVGVVSWSALPGPFKELLSSLQPGQVSSIVTIEGKHAVFQLNSMNDGGAQSLEQAYAQIEKKLREPRLQERFKEYMQQLRSKAVVDIRI